MKLTDLPDPRLRRLAASVQRSEALVRDLLASMVDAPLATRVATYRALQPILERLRRETRQWAIRYLPIFFNEAASGLARSLTRAGIDAPSLADAMQPPLRGLLLAFSERVDASIQSINVLATRLVHATDSLDAADPRTRNIYVRGVNAGSPAPVARAAALRAFRERVLKHPAAVTGATTGQTRHYELAYYVAMVGSSAFVQARNMPARIFSQMLDMDLVRISRNPSLVGDYCDEYAGAVFSLSGLDPRFPALDSTPNAGPPFHPHCYHFLTLVMPNEDLTNEAVVPDDALLRPGETDTKRLAQRHSH